MTAENDKLLNERRKLLQQLDEEQHNRKDNYLTASLSKCRFWLWHTHKHTHTHFCFNKMANVKNLFFFFLRTSVNKCNHFDFPPCYFFLSLQSGFSGDGKQETGKESSPCVQSAGSTGTQTPKQTVSKICWGTNTASNSLTHNCISYCYCGVTRCCSTLSKLSGKALSVALYSFVNQETLSSSDQTNNITAPARQFALCRSSRHLSCYSVLKLQAHATSSPWNEATWPQASERSLLQSKLHF